MKPIPTPGRRRLGLLPIRGRLSHLLLAGALLVANGARAQAPSLVKDIYPGVSSTASASAGFERILGVSGGKAFLYGMEDWNRGLWVTDGTAGGTRAILDLTVGFEGTDVNGTFFFSAPYQEGGSLWKTDGTAAGTVFVSRFNTDPLVTASVLRSSKVGDRLSFVVDDGVHGAELWTSNGTREGTKLVKDLTPGPSSVFDQTAQFVDVGGTLLFSCSLNPGCGLWRSDGTSAGTVPLADLGYVYQFVNVNGTLFFTATDAAHGMELWKSDGTVGGTVLVRDILPGAASSNPVALVSFGGALYFRLGSDGSTWKSDGTEGGTLLVHTLPGSDPLVPSGDRLFTVSGTELWASDGTPAGTYSVQAPVFAPNDGLPAWLTDVNGTLLFSAVDAEHGLELWRSDGTPGGTHLVKGLDPGPGNSFAGPFFVTPSKVYFTAWTSATGNEIYRTDGTDTGTVLVKDVQPGQSTYATPLGLLGELLLFAPDDGVHGTEPWRTDGTPDGTFLLGDLTSGSAPSQASPLGLLNGEFLLAVSDGSSTALWKTDGTVSGTIAVGPMPTWGSSGIELGDALVFSGSDAANGTELWRTDGTAAGTTLLKDINPAGPSSAYPIARLENRVVFWADDGTHGFEPWATDGTPTGTILLRDINPGPAMPLGSRTVVLGPTLFFWAYDGVHGFELWKTDGTAPGTALVRDIAPGPAGSMFIEHFAAAGHEVFFTASDRVSGRELWRSDGTEAGTTRVADLAPGIRGSAAPWEGSGPKTVLARSGGKVFYTATEGTTGHELWSLPVPTKLHTIVPCRVADTRDPAGPTGGAPLGSWETVIVQVTGRCGIPSTALSIAANVTVVSPSAAGSLSVFAGGPIDSGTTEVPVTAGKTRALHFIPGLGTAGSLSFRPSLEAGGSTDVILDVSGWFE